MGHFFPARWFKMRVEKFYLFFNPWFSVYKVQKGDTEYGLGWLPLGGYVKIAGMVDESMDTEQLAQPAQEWEFRSKPAWQRLIVMLGGVFVNFVLGFFIWGMLLWAYGREFMPNSNAIHGIVPDEMGKYMGLQVGDKLLKVGNETVDKLSPKVLLRGIVVGDAKTLTVERAGATQTLDLPSDIVGKLASYKGMLIKERIPFVIDTAVVGNAGAKVGLQKGDSLIAINDSSVRFFDEVVGLLKENASKTVKMTFVRQGEPKEFSVEVSAEGRIGVGVKQLPTQREQISLAQAFPEGVSEGLGFLSAQMKAFGKMFSGEIKASESLGGFGSIAQMFPPTWDWYQFWHITAVLSLILGFMNLLPIPALDGGHALFLLFEIVFRRPLPQKFMEYAQMVGILLLFSLIIFANGMDIYKAIFGK